MAKSLKLRVIAEGVETIEQLRFLERLDCDKIQGYYFSKPLIAEEFRKLLESGRVLGRSLPETVTQCGDSSNQQIDGDVHE
jgi:predicted signal transduction protein with EAL and GGDEF domain